MSRTIVVGDIHGCFDELLLLIEKLDLQADDQFISVGDLIVKGNKNKEVLDLFIQEPRFSAVLGNHDLALIRYWRGETTTLKKPQMKAYEDLESNPFVYQNYLGARPLMIDLDSHVVVHAGVRPGIALESQSPEDLTELRTLGEDRTSRQGTPWYDVYEGEKIVLFGHWPAREPRRGKRAIGLDTGCVYGNLLTAYIIESNTFVSVSAKQAYDPPKNPLK